MPRTKAIPKVNSAALRTQRLRQRRTGERPSGYAAISRAAALEVRRRMFEDFSEIHRQLFGSHLYGVNITNAILRAMHRLVREGGEEHPVDVMYELAREYRPAANPVHFLNHVVARRLGYPDVPDGEAHIELAYPDPIAGI
ncbi:MAG: hypothetical protein WD009_14075 [Phycisphaeraceae bacterium]